MPETEGLPRLLSIGQLAERLGTPLPVTSVGSSPNAVSLSSKSAGWFGLTPMTSRPGSTADASAAQELPTGPRPQLDGPPN
jgi:hypothetical protein